MKSTPSACSTHRRCWPALLGHQCVVHQTNAPTKPACCTHRHRQHALLGAPVRPHVGPLLLKCLSRAVQLAQFQPVLAAAPDLRATRTSRLLRGSAQECTAARQAWVSAWRCRFRSALRSNVAAPSHSAHTSCCWRHRPGQPLATRQRHCLHHQRRSHLDGGIEHNHNVFPRALGCINRLAVRRSGARHQAARPAVAEIHCGGLLLAAATNLVLGGKHAVTDHGGPSLAGLRRGGVTSGGKGLASNRRRRVGAAVAAAPAAAANVAPPIIPLPQLTASTCEPPVARRKCDSRAGMLCSGLRASL